MDEGLSANVDKVGCQFDLPDRETRVSNALSAPRARDFPSLFDALTISRLVIRTTAKEGEKVAV